MYLRAWHNENEPPDERVPVEPLLENVAALFEAVDQKPKETTQIRLLIDQMSGDGFEQACLDTLIEKLDGLLSIVVEQNGKISVRYVGDLKPIGYDLHARFYHLTQHSTDDDLRTIIKDAITRGRNEVSLINLANVRDIKITIGNTKVTSLDSALRIVRGALEKFKEWDEAGFWAKLSED